VPFLTDPVFLCSLFTVAVVSGGTAAVAGFGIGSLLTPLLAVALDTSTAVAAVAIPHAVATAIRGWRLRRFVDVRVLKQFGLASAVGGLMGALLYARFPARALTVILGLLLTATGVTTVSDWTSRWSPRGPAVGLFGVLSGLFGGLAGNQGGLRAAALVSFRLEPVPYVATATATALLVDAVRTPIYVWRAGPQLASLLVPVAVATAGVILGTLLGERILLGLPRDRFRLIVGTLIGLLGIGILFQTFAGG
jgi:uncharacterized membrane protein YfcA